MLYFRLNFSHRTHNLGDSPSHQHRVASVLGLHPGPFHHHDGGWQNGVVKLAEYPTASVVVVEVPNPYLRNQLAFFVGLNPYLRNHFVKRML